jgi:hypothetical protein
MRDLFCEPPDYQRVEWDPADLNRMQRALDAERKEPWTRRLRYYLAWQLFGRRGFMILPDGKSYEDIEHELTPRQRKRLNVRVGRLRTWLGRLVAPAQPPISKAYNLLMLNRIMPALPACLRLDTATGRLTLNDETLDDPVLVREWLRFRYSACDLPVNVTPVEGKTCTNGCIWTSGATETIRAKVSFLRTGGVEEVRFREVPKND